MNEHAEKMKAREEARKESYYEMLQELGKMAHFVAYDLETPSPLRKDYEETIIAINNAFKHIKDLQAKLFN